MTRRSLDEVLARAEELADAFENYEPTSDDQDAPVPPVMALRLAQWRRRSVAADAGAFDALDEPALQEEEHQQ